MVCFRSVVLLIVLSFLAGCQRAESTSSADRGAGGADSAKFRIAVIPKGTTHDFWKSVHAGAKQAEAEVGNVEVLWKGTMNEKDKEGQIRLVEGFIVEQVDGIVLAPIDRDALVPVVRRAKQRGIPTVIFDSGLSDEESLVSYVATDNYHGGQIAAEHLAELLGGEGDVILIRYQAGSESTEQRENGFLDALENYPDIRVLSESQRVSSDAQQALEVSSSLLIAHGDEVDGAFTVCEPLNKGFLRALENRNLAGEVKFVGFDPDPRMVQGLREGSVHGIVLQDPVNMGYQAVKMMAAHLNGEPLEKRLSTGEFLATPENMDEPRMQELLNPQQYEE